MKKVARDKATLRVLQFASTEKIFSVQARFLLQLLVLISDYNFFSTVCVIVFCP